MDFATHAFVPMAGALAALGFLRRDEPADRGKAAVAAVFGIAGFSPDLDSLVDPLSEQSDALYWLQHRGVSHALVGGPVFALVALLLLVGLARLWPSRLGLFAYRPMLVPAAILGSWTHILLDGVTYSGVPLWWPFAFGRWGFPLFPWVLSWAFLYSALVLLLHAFGRLSRRRVAQAGSALVAALVLVAGARAATLPWGETHVHPTHDIDVWTVATEEANSTWRVERYRGGERSAPMWFDDHAPPEARDAVERALATDAYKGFLLGSFGPIATRAERSADGWNVTFTDVVQRYDALQGLRWAPVEPHDAWGYVHFHVAGERIDVLHRGW